MAIADQLQSNPAEQQLEAQETIELNAIGKEVDQMVAQTQNLDTALSHISSRFDGLELDSEQIKSIQAYLGEEPTGISQNHMELVQQGLTQRLKEYYPDLIDTLPSGTFMDDAPEELPSSFMDELQEVSTFLDDAEEQPEPQRQEEQMITGKKDIPEIVQETRQKRSRGVYTQDQIQASIAAARNERRQKQKNTEYDPTAMASAIEELRAEEEQSPQLKQLEELKSLYLSQFPSKGTEAEVQQFISVLNLPDLDSASKFAILDALKGKSAADSISFNSSSDELLQAFLQSE